LKVFNISFPVKHARKKHRNSKHHPWVTQKFLESSKLKTKLLKIKSSRPTQLNILNYGEHNCSHNKLKRRLKSSYYGNILENHKYDMKKSWSILNGLIGKQNDKSTLPNSFIINDQDEVNLNKITNGFNNFFGDIGRQTADHIPQSRHNYKHYLGPSLGFSMFIEPVSEQIVINTTISLKSKISSGYDELSTKLMKQTIHQVSAPLTHIIFYHWRSTKSAQSR